MIFGILMMGNFVCLPDSMGVLCLGAIRSGGEVVFYSGGSTTNFERMRLDSTGNFGIGDRDLTYQLEVDGEAEFDGALRARDSTGIGLRDDAGNLGLWVEDGGEVGIGTTSPSELLHIVKEVDGEYTALLVENDQVGQNDNVAIALAPAGFTSNPAKIVGVAPGASDIDIVFYTVDNTNQKPIMKLTGNGNIETISTTGGFIVPRMTNAEQSLITGVNGMIIYDTTNLRFEFFENGVWVTK